MITESFPNTLFLTRLIGISTTPWHYHTCRTWVVQSCQPDGLSICIDVEHCDRCGSDDKRDESDELHSEFFKQQGIQLEVVKLN